MASPMNPQGLDRIFSDSSGPGSDPTGFAKRVVLGLLQNFFADIEEFRFSYDDAESRVRISDKYTVNLKEIEKRPAIIVDRSDMRWSNVGIDQFWTQGGRTSADQRPPRACARRLAGSSYRRGPAAYLVQRPRDDARRQFSKWRWTLPSHFQPKLARRPIVLHYAEGSFHRSRSARCRSRTRSYALEVPWPAVGGER